MSGERLVASAATGDGASAHPQVAGPRPAATSGAIVMAGGIFIAAALQRMPLGAAATPPLVLLVAFLWVVLALAVLLRLWRDGLAAYTRHRLASFGIGTWVAGTAIVARLTMLAFSNFPWLADGLFLLSLAGWLWFIPLALQNLMRLLDATPGEQPSGIVLLTTVATQAVAVLALRSFGTALGVRWAATALIALGAAAYVFGLFLIIRRYAQQPLRQVVTAWENSNCILHGAISITGLAAVLSGEFLPGAILACWLAAAIALVAIEAIEIARLVGRWRRLGARRAMLVHDVSQWARNFTFGMFYAFTLAYAEQFSLAGEHPLLSALRDAVLAYGQYLVLILLVAQTFVLLASLAERGRGGAG